MGLYAKALIDTRLLDWPALIAKLTIHPARVIRKDLGTLAVGGVADVTVIDPKKRWTVRPDQYRSKSRNCPYQGWKLKGKPVATIVGGQIKHTA